MASAIEQIAVEKNQLAISLSDQGSIEEARRVLRENAAFLADNAGATNRRTCRTTAVPRPWWPKG